MKHRTTILKLLSALSLTGSLLLYADQSDFDIGQVLELHSHNVSEIPEFSGEIIKLSPKWIQLHTRSELVVKDIHTVWDASKFNTPRVPARIGSVEDQASFTEGGVPRCLHLPIKCPDSDIRVPEEYAQFTEALQKILDHEYSANDHFDEYYAYLTVDQSFVPRESFQRVPGPHVDGIPRDRDNPQTVVDHAYLVTNAIPTRFYFQPFEMEQYDLKKHHFFAIFRALADEKQTFTVHPFDINLMNAYSVHTPVPSECDVMRTFIRLEFSVLEFDRQGNSINRAFAEDAQYPDYPFTYVPRPIPDHLTIPINVFEDRPFSTDLYICSSLDSFGRERLVKALRENPREHTAYKDLEQILAAIRSEGQQGIVLVRNHIAQGFALFSEDEKRLNVSVLYTHSRGPNAELTVSAIKTLKNLAGSRDLVFVEDRNNADVVPYFERAAYLAKVPYYLRRS